MDKNITYVNNKILISRQTRKTDVYYCTRVKVAEVFLIMTGYHANDRYRCNKFITEHDFLIISKDDAEFLGTGMYFWEHQSRAEWWLAEKGKESIVSAEINLETVLDLTDEEKLSYIEKATNFVQKAIERKGIKQNELGKRLNFLFEAHPWFYKYDSIRGHRYTNRDESDFLFGTKLTSQCVDIYCVRQKPELVTERKWVIK